VYIPLQTPVAPTSPVARLVRMLDELCAVIAARKAGGVLTVPLFFLLWKRVRHTALRAIRLAARVAAGTPPRAPRPRTTPRPPRPPVLRLPGSFAWVVTVVPGTAVYGLHLQYLLAEPALAPLVADPRFRRLVNPLCRMLGIPKLPPLPPVRPVRPVPPRSAAVAPTPATPEPATPEPDAPGPDAPGPDAPEPAHPRPAGCHPQPPPTPVAA
jgi:hypothetical protein